MKNDFKISIKFIEEGKGLKEITTNVLANSIQDCLQKLPHKDWFLKTKMSPDYKVTITIEKE